MGGCRGAEPPRPISHVFESVLYIQIVLVLIVLILVLIQVFKYYLTTAPLRCSGHILLVVVVYNGVREMLNHASQVPFCIASLHTAFVGKY